jgi:hypothetical protein
MLFHSISENTPGVDIEQVFCGLQEEVDSAALQRAWQRVVERHEALRTSFRWESVAEPEQEVHSGIELAMEELDWRDVPVAEQESRFEEWLAEDRRRGFDLTQAPLMRVALFRLRSEEGRVPSPESRVQRAKVVWTVHH